MEFFKKFETKTEQIDPAFIEKAEIYVKNMIHEHGNSNPEWSKLKASSVDRNKKIKEISKMMQEGKFQSKESSDPVQA